MNQIIYNTGSKPLKHDKKNFSNKSSKKGIVFKIEFFIICSILIFLTSYYIYMKADISKKEKIAKSLAQGFGITKIYSEGNSYTSSRLSQEVIVNGDKTFTVIGFIKIDAISVSYPILDGVSDDALKIGACKFYGPMPNEER